jgi:hypothetical protein
MAARKSSDAETNRGKDLMRSTKSSGISLMVEAVRGDGLIGRVGFDSTLNLMSDMGSGDPMA